MSANVVMWDFDGTLASRPGLWGGCVLEVLDERLPGHGITLEHVRAGMKGGFPWNRHEQAHPELAEPDAWWAVVTRLIERALARCGVDAAHRRELAWEVRHRFIDGTRGWEVFADTRAALELVAAAGWSSVILSNHVPELAALVDQLGISPQIERVFSSALIGFEKPHPEAFRLAVAECGRPRRLWMVGDNPVADIAGAEALGIPAVLIRGPGQAKRHAADAAGAAALIVDDVR